MMVFHPRKHPSSLHAFTLVELSIVIVVLGLLTGGILGGQALVHSAELRSVSTSFQKYNTAVVAFREKYNGWPGDMSDATRYWPAAGNCSASSNSNPAIAPTPSGAVCNSDGGGWIGPYDTSFYTVWYESEEVWAWQELSLAGLVEGSYNGAGIRQVPPTAGVNVPKGKISGSIYQLQTWIVHNTATVIAYQNGDTNWRNSIIFSGASNTAPINVPTYMGFDAVLSTEDAMYIDKKLDDGMPAAGLITGYPSNVSGAGGNRWCASTYNADLAQYDMSRTGLNCFLSYRMN